MTLLEFLSERKRRFLWERSLRRQRRTGIATYFETPLEILSRFLGKLWKEWLSLEKNVKRILPSKVEGDAQDIKDPGKDILRRLSSSKFTSRFFEDSGGSLGAAQRHFHSRRVTL